MSATIAAAPAGRSARASHATAATIAEITHKTGLSSGTTTPNGSKAYTGAGVTTQMARNARKSASASSPQAAAARSPVQPRESGVQPNMEESVI